MCKINVCLNSQRYLLTADGQEIEMTVLGQNGNQVRLGFEADKSIDIVRSELLYDHFGHLSHLMG